MDFQSYVEQSAAQVLANHEILMATPSASRLTSFYPTPSESENTIAQAVCNSGQLTVQANSKNFGQSSDFIVSTPNLMDCPHLQLSFKVPALSGGDVGNVYAGSYHDGWGFDCIDQIEVTVSNSNVSNMQVKGHALRQWSLLQCKNETERKRLLKIAGEHKIGKRNDVIEMSACVPLSFLFWRAAGGVKGGFPIDGRALNGPIIFRIRFNPLRYFFGPCLSRFNPNGVSGVPMSTNEINSHVGSTTFAVTQFDNCNLTFRTYQLMDGAFSVSKALEANPGFIYSIPSMWLNSYNQTANLNSEGYSQINLNSAPAGMIQAMILRFRPINETPTTAYDDGSATNSNAEDKFNSRLNYDPYDPDNSIVQTSTGNSKERVIRPYVPWSLPLKELKLEYSGQAIFWARSAEELSQFYADTFNDDLKTDICGAPLHLSVIQKYLLGSTGAVQYRNVPERSSVQHEEQIIIIPLMHNGDDVFRKRGFENLPHYSGSTLQLSFTVDKYNYYRADGYDRIQNEPDGTLSVTLNTAKIDDSASSCHRYPSNRTQKLAGNDAATARVEPNNNPNATGAVAYPGVDGNGRVSVDVTYAVAALSQITNGTFEIQL